MGNSLELGYLGIEAADRQAFGAYLRDVIGLVPGDPPTKGVYGWRVDRKARRVLVHDGPANDAAYLGFVAVDDGTLAERVSRIQAWGASITEGTAEEARLRGVERMVHTLAPWGTRVELAVGLEDGAPFDSGLMPGGFVTDGVGLGHAVFFVPGSPEDHARATTVVEEALGFVLTDFLEMGEGLEMFRANFYHCNGRHHTLALGFVPVPATPAKLHHILIETVTADNVGAAFDRAVAASVPIPSGLGKHPNDGMYSFYSVTPAGFQLELGSGGVVVDDPWPVARFDRISSWGHQPYTPALA